MEVSSVNNSDQTPQQWLPHGPHCVQEVTCFMRDTFTYRQIGIFFNESVHSTEAPSVAKRGAHARCKLSFLIVVANLHVSTKRRWTVKKGVFRALKSRKLRRSSLKESPDILFTHSLKVFHKFCSVTTFVIAQQIVTAILPFLSIYNTLSRG